MEAYEVGVLTQVGITNTQQAEQIQSRFLIEVTLAETCANNYYCQVTAEVAVNLLARIFPHIKLVIPSCDTLLPNAMKQSFGEHLQEIRLMARNWLNVQGPTETVRLVIGDEGHGDVFAIGVGWLAAVGNRPSLLVIGDRDDDNPLGAVMAGILAVAEVFKRTLGQAMQTYGESLPFLTVTEPYILSLLDYKCYKNVLPPENSVLKGPTLQNPVMFGIGSIGSGCLHSLSYSPGLSGSITVVDHDRKLDRRNLLRYSFLTESDLLNYGNNPKTEWILYKLNTRQPKLKIIPCCQTVSDWLAEQNPDYKVELAISAVDSALARVQIADVLARRVVNAATGAMSVDVTRHSFGQNGRACLACLYESQYAIARGIQQYVDTTGIPHERVVQLVNKNDVLNDSDLDYIVSRGIIPPEAKQQWSGSSLMSLIRERSYAGAIITLPGGTSQVVTLAFVSQMAGTLLAAEVLKETFGLGDKWQGTRFHIDAKYLPDSGSITDLQGARDIDGNILPGRCLCEHGFRREIYKRKYF